MRGVYIAAVVMLAAVLAVTQATSVPPPPPQDCKYWCKDHNDQNYCCGLPHEEFPPFTSEHPGFCPAVRDSCTGVRVSRPKLCPHDGVCDFGSKCCYDACLEHHVCKTAEPPFDIPH
nr:crustin-like protein 3 [Eriocheir sinensis]